MNKRILRAIDDLSSFSGPNIGTEKMKCAAKPSRSLSFDDAVEIWIRHWKKEFQHRIAADFDVNPGRVNEVLKGRRHVGSREVAIRKSH